MYEQQEAFSLTEKRHEELEEAPPELNQPVDPVTDTPHTESNEVPDPYSSPPQSTDPPVEGVIDPQPVPEEIQIEGKRETQEEEKTVVVREEKILSGVETQVEEEMLHGMPKAKLFTEFPGEFKSLEQYALSLIDSPKWHTVEARPNIVTKKLSRSKFNTEVPVFQCVMDFQEPIPAEFILNMFDDPDYRMNWDKRITQMNKIYNSKDNSFLHYHVIHFNAPLEDRDFLVKYFIRMIDNETRVIFKSTSNSEFKETKGTERAKTYFGLYRVWEEPGTSRMQMLTQPNLFFSVKRIQDMIPEYLSSWLAKFRLRVINEYRRVTGRPELEPEPSQPAIV